jgi:dipeptidyl aminopeptidase/acylaminoacyl peptidase
MRPTSRRIAVGGAVVLGVLSTGAWWAYRGGDGDGAPMRVVPLTTLRGHESWPTFSPDGSQVAFAWGGEKDDNFDIYVKMVGRSEVRRLTSDPLADSAPSWSPDGQQIAFVRQDRGWLPAVDGIGAGSAASTWLPARGVGS